MTETKFAAALVLLFALACGASASDTAEPALESATLPTSGATVETGEPLPEVACSADAECVPGLYCLPGSDGETAVCRPLRGTWGEGCSLAAEAVAPECEPGLYCAPYTAEAGPDVGVCQPIR